MNVSQADIVRVRNVDRIQERLVAADHAVAVIVGDGNVAGVLDRERQTERPLSALLFRLQSIDLPVGNMVQLHLIANVVFARKLVDPALGRGVRDQHPGLRERARRPDVGEGSAAAVGHPQARILTVPPAVEIGIGRMRVVVDRRHAGHRRAVPAQKTNIVHQRVLARHPLRAHGAAIDAVGVETDSGHDVRAALRSLQQRLRRARPLKGRRRVRDIKLRRGSDAARSAPYPAAA